LMHFQKVRVPRAYVLLLPKIFVCRAPAQIGDNSPNYLKRSKNLKLGIYCQNFRHLSKSESMNTNEGDATFRAGWDVLRAILSGVALFTSPMIAVPAGVDGHPAIRSFPLIFPQIFFWLLLL